MDAVTMREVASHVLNGNRDDRFDGSIVVAGGLAEVRRGDTVYRVRALELPVFRAIGWTTRGGHDYRRIVGLYFVVAQHGGLYLGDVGSVPLFAAAAFTEHELEHVLAAYGGTAVDLPWALEVYGLPPLSMTGDLRNPTMSVVDLSVALPGWLGGRAR